MVEQIKARITEIETAIQQLIQNHSTLMGHLSEAKNMLELAIKEAPAIATAVSDVQAAIPAVEVAAPVVEDAVDAVAAIA
jgi:hypothetical protein